MPAVIAAARRLFVCQLPWRMAAGERYSMTLLYLYVTGRPGFALPWSAMQKDVPPFPVKDHLRAEE
jgi:hypothetical protein